MDSLTERCAQSSRKINPVRWFPGLSQCKKSVAAKSVKTKIVRWFPDLRQCCTSGGEKQNPLPKLSANGETTTNVCLFPKRPRSNTTTRRVIAPWRATNTVKGLCAIGKTGSTVQTEHPGKRQCPNAIGEESREIDDVQDMSESFVVKEMFNNSVAQELRDNDIEEEESSDDDDEEEKSSDDNEEEEELSKDEDSDDTDSEDDEGKEESEIDVDMFKKSLSG
ncbi:hypothetical protein CBR_g58182 [Chara braunii]|uniref:Uncharacterized protein n=1 Tax=Chara braunii TaxID=69332 RepID=A0A388MEN7_CHABU|nr:hypothetical protein CBR_g58182 [Chara braunii]|eukprot:GBG93020.1 hypothetical protein CBR_g58182 [Chara braunii]